MDVGVLSVRYAKALFDYALEKGVESQVYRELVLVAHSFASNPDLRTMLENPLLPSKEKISLLHTAVGDVPKSAEGDVPGGKISVELKKFFDLVVERKREGYMYSIALVYANLYRNFRHIGVAKIITAVPLGKSMEERIIDISSKRLHCSIELERVVDPAIEGGFIFDINDYRLDASVATQIRKFKQQFIEKNRRIV
ncbi:MAG: F0F1 ATP synthase subunit delta [Bacteroidales bacterium]|jgi:ATP synthase, F1 delta subunit|nr:F0F1 ATP synthase subunit delta [Bacteroidales bacterium]